MPDLRPSPVGAPLMALVDRRWRPAGVLASALVGLWMSLAVAQARADSFSETDVRAVFLYNFAVFVDWPADAFESPSSSLRYCLLGAGDLRTSLERVLAGEQVDQRALTLTPAREPGWLRRCHVLYLDGTAVPRPGQLLKAVSGVPVLTVGDSESFVRSGGMIALVRRGDRLHALINRAAAEDVGLQISSKLLSLATLVTAPRGETPP